MPIYEYTAADRGCAYCEARFDLLQKMSDDALTQCPQCGAPVMRIISAPSVAVGGAHLTQASHAEKRGFTQYRRTAKGVYEKAYGKGPRYISDK